MPILVVDDSRTMRRIRTRVLARMGFPATSETANRKDGGKTLKPQIASVRRPPAAAEQTSQVR